MPITETQRQLRTRHLGSSDSAAVLGVDEYRTAHDVYVEKVLNQIDLGDANDAVEVGNYVESSILRWCADQLGERIVRNRRRVSPDGVLAANHDALVVDKPWGVEGKATAKSDGWGEAGTDEVPNRVLIQCQHQMYVSDLELVWVPVLMMDWGMRLRMYKVPRSDKIIGAIVEEDHRFWQEHIVPAIPPADFRPSLETLRRVVRVPEKTVDLSGDPRLLAEWQQYSHIARQAAKDADEAKAAILAALGDAEAGDFGELGTVTYMEQKSPPRYDRKSLTADGVFEKYASVGTHRVLRFKAQKGES